jgi:hypothetical protein
VRSGYRRLHVLLRREGWSLGQNKTRRIYRELGLQLRSKTPKRRVKAKLREDRRNATRPNETWAMGFVHDQMASAGKSRANQPTMRSLKPSRVASEQNVWFEEWYPQDADEGCAGSGINHHMVGLRSFEKFDMEVAPCEWAGGLVRLSGPTESPGAIRRPIVACTGDGSSIAGPAEDVQPPTNRRLPARGMVRRAKVPARVVVG